MDRTGDAFQEATKYYRDRMSGLRLDWSSQPELYKEYPGSEKIRLSRPVCRGEVTLDGAIRMRKSVRQFRDEAISEEMLSYLLWACTGVSREQGGYEFRTAPSAGALYPVETYLVVNNVEQVDAGTYHYSIRGHQLEVLRKGDFSVEAAKAALDQPMCMAAAVVFVWTAVFQRSRWKYGQRAYRYVYLDAGHIAENLALAAVGLGLGSCQIGALYDDEANSLLDVDGDEESVIYMSVVGHPM